MKRRTFLGAATAGVAGLAGCQGFGSDGRDSTYGVPARETTTDRTTTIPGIEPTVDPEPFDPLTRAVSRALGNERRIAFADEPLSSHPGPGRYRVGFSSKPTLSSPATVWIEFENTGESSLGYDFGPSPPFSNYWASGTKPGSSGRTLLLVPVDDRPFPYGDLVPEAPTNGRWVATDALGTPEGSVDSNPVELAPGESIVGEYALLWHPDADDQTPWGTFVFSGAEWTPSEIAVSMWPPDERIRPNSRFGSDDLPSYSELPFDPPTSWLHRWSSDDPPVYLSPGRQRRELPFTVMVPAVENYSVATLTVDGWFVAKYHGGDWKPIAPFGPELWADERVVPPGGSFGWELTVDNEGNGESETSRSTRTLSDVGGGYYAIGAFVDGVPTEPLVDRPVVLSGPPGGSPPLPTERSAVTAIVELVDFGRANPVSPTADATLTERSEGTAVVDLDRDARETGTDPAAFVLEAGAAGSDATELIAEQINQLPALRNAVAFFEEGTETVRVRTDSWTAGRPIVAYGSDGSLAFSYEAREFTGRFEETG
jgi:hypothetical protein